MDVSTSVFLDLPCPVCTVPSVVEDVEGAVKEDKPPFFCVTCTAGFYPIPLSEIQSFDKVKMEAMALAFYAEAHASKESNLNMLLTARGIRDYLDPLFNGGRPGMPVIVTQEEFEPIVDKALSAYLLGAAARGDTVQTIDGIRALIRDVVLTALSHMAHLYKLSEGVKTGLAIPDQGKPAE